MPDQTTRNAGTVPLTSAPSTPETDRPTLRQVASFEHQVTGVAVANDGRIFVNFPRWTEDAPISVGVLTEDGSVRPYPDDEWNRWRNAKRDEITPHDHWVCVQATLCDTRGNLWVIDPGAPAQSHVVPGAPKLVCIDLTSDKVVRTIEFDLNIAPQGSYLNDVRLSPDGNWAYLTDSGVQGAIVVVDLKSGNAWRTLDGHASTQMDPDVIVHIDGVPLRRPDGRGVEFSADGIALSPDGQFLYWQAVKGKTVYRIATAYLLDRAATPEQVGNRVEAVLEHGPADGLHIDAEGNLYLTAVQDHAIKVWDGQTLKTLVQDTGVRWTDTFAEGPDGSLYLTDSRIPEMPYFKPGQPIAVASRLLIVDGFTLPREAR